MKWDKRDRYGRIVGQVWVAFPDACPDHPPDCPKTLNASLAQITVGLAWHYKRYHQEQSEEGRQRYAFAEQEARAGKVGLWQDKNSMPPWEWRRLRKIMSKPSIVALPCNDMTYTTTRIVYITFSPGYQVYVTVKDRLPRRLTVINADVVTGDRGIGLIDHISHFLQ